MNKRGDIEWDELGKTLLALVLLLVLVIAIWLLRDKLFSLLETVKNILRFG